MPIKAELAGRSLLDAAVEDVRSWQGVEQLHLSVTPATRQQTVRRMRGID
jgi:hypothetical protein